MSWRKLAPHIYAAAKATATGASITLGSTVFSCYLAIEIEAASHRTLFTFFPHWYANVDYANGIDPELLASARLMYGAPRSAGVVESAQQLQHQQQQLENILVANQENKEKVKSKDESAEEDRQTRTIFAIENMMEPAVKRVQDLSTIDLSACAMTA